MNKKNVQIDRKIEGTYWKARMKFISAKTEQDYNECIDICSSIPKHKGAQELKKECWIKIQILKGKDPNLIIKQRKKIKIISIIASCLVCIMLLIIPFNLIICKNTRLDLIGKTFKGSCVGSYLKWNVEIHFTDKNHCEIDFDYYLNDTNYGGTYEDVPYSLSGGIFGLKLVWDDSIGPDNGAEPFVLEKSDGEYILYTPNWDSHMSMYLYEW